MARDPKPINHGGDHRPGGPDEIPSNPWVLIGDSGAPAFKNGWANDATDNSPMRIMRKVGGGIEITGSLDSASGTAGTVVFTIPQSWGWPSYPYFLHGATSTSSVTFKVDTNGDVYYVGAV